MAVSKIARWGNSDALRVPSDILKSLNWTTGTEINLNVENGKIIIEKKSSYTLKDLFKDYNGDYQCKEFDWGEPMGNELW